MKYKAAAGQEKGLYCNIEPRKVSRVSTPDGQDVMLKVILEKQTNDHRDKIIENPEANIFYILDSALNIIAVLHARGFTFAANDKWEIIQNLIYQHNAPISDIPADDNAFEIKTALEALMPEVIVGDIDDIASAKADYDLNLFLKGSDFSDKRVLFLETVTNSPLPESPDAEAAIKGDNIRFEMENPKARLDLNGRTLTIVGHSSHGRLNIIESQSGGKLVVAGNNVNLEIAAYDADGDINNDAVSFTGTGICVINGQLNSGDNLTVGSPDAKANTLINGVLTADNIKLGDLFLKFLLPGVIVGSAADVSDGRATHALSDLAMADLSGKRVLFLETVEALTIDLVIPGNNIRFDMESPATELDLNGNTLEFNGDRLQGCLNITNAKTNTPLKIYGDYVSLDINMTNSRKSSFEAIGMHSYFRLTSDNEDTFK